MLSCYQYHHHPLISSLLVGSVCVAFDSYAHGSFIVTPFEFFRVNAFLGIGSHYGTHNWHWYIYNGLPTVLGVHSIPFLLGSFDVAHDRRQFPERFILLTSIGFTLAVYTLLAHKEARFMLALLPMCQYIGADYLSRWSRKASRWAVWLVAIMLLVCNTIPAAYFARVHQAGTTAVMPQLAQIARDYRGPADTADAAKFLFLMPCHSTPYFSHVHRNVTMRFLTCEPNLAQTDGYVDEADRFYADPAKWLRQHLPVYPVSALPTHVVMFDVLRNQVADFLAANYRPLLSLPHMDPEGWLEMNDKRMGETVLVYERLPDKVEPVKEETVDEARV